MPHISRATYLKNNISQEQHISRATYLKSHISQEPHISRTTSLKNNIPQNNISRDVMLGKSFHKISVKEIMNGAQDVMPESGL